MNRAPKSIQKKKTPVQLDDKTKEERVGEEQQRGKKRFYRSWYIIWALS
jgi:hypothetical protein